MAIPFLDLKAQYASIKPEIDAAIAGVVESCHFIGGEAVRGFERNFARYSGAEHGVGSCSGTSALHLALLGAGVKPGDEVITACNTFIATTEAITHAGARPVLVDVDEATQLIDPARIEAAITPRTRAIVPVHLYGQPADMDAVRDIAARRKLRVVADAAQSHGADIGGDRGKTLGDTTAFSFYPGKNLGAYGDGGLVATDDADAASLMRALADHGSREKYHHLYEGWNYRLDAMQAAVLDVKLRHLEAWTEARRSRAARYDRAFAGSAVVPISATAGRRHVYHLYVVRVPDRERTLAQLKEKGIGAGIHYPIPLHLQPAYAYLGLKQGAFPVAEKVVASIVSLPMYAELSDAMVDEAAAAVIASAS
ncbi:MAG: DegT/DnrJ/EryC1/StrS family aminotransferase [Candidatus Krumholzibacteria bacterium]|nr:DegT/DnrJ/EryC1/StrS family aminotransferase [Candidatus Krumholzibacteria bacterium]MDH4337440.1 DegT/DnrJ/EryC1/StrS family aminotransferase [Candidatus Krumholzibacteria bacterium]MDH5270180.1 DegT/DnrJ/EryC1/StrS family aminotransferase [Candidatus Krumholzibacteria bacterium]MDH5627444.1 DegT/DnrJ/EryC1/StrS family aminotransferase [Candidatus Krumholzibacteria bacterium]